MQDAKYEAPTCSECFNETVWFSGTGTDHMFRICSQWAQPGHLTDQQIKAKIAERRRLANPSGRFA